jgi:hypothetical protein
LRRAGCTASIGAVTMTTRRAMLPLLATVALALAPSLRADDDAVSRTVKCTRSSTAQLVLREEGGDHSGKGRGSGDTISVTLRVTSRRSGRTWSVVLLHERRIVYRGTRRTRPPRATFVLSYSLPSWYGSEEVAARARGPLGEVCRVSARL